MENLQGMGAPTREIGGSWLKPCAMAFAVALALGLSGCGGGGGANVRPTPPAPPPAGGAGFTGGEIVVGSNDVTVLSEDIHGSIDLIKNGTGTLVLTGTDTYTGGTTIKLGTLQIGNGGTTGSITGDVTNDALLVFDRSDSVIFSGIVSGSGSLRQAGTGSLTLTGANTYAGGTTISHGTLQLGNGGTSGSVIGNVTNDGSLVFNRSDDVTFNGTVSGSGSLEQAGAGTLILTGANTYTGGTTISHGRLQLGDGGITGSIVGDITDNGWLVFNRSNDVTFNGTISGSGSLEQAGPGRLILSGANTYAGGTTVQGGTLELVSDGAVGTGSVTVDDSNSQNATLTVNSGVSLSNHVVLSNGATLNNAGALVDNADRPLESHTGTVNVFNHDGGSITGHIAASFYDGATIHNGAGSTISGTIEGIVALGGDSITVSNDGGSILSDQGRGLFLSGASVTVTNRDGGVIAGVSGIHLFSAGAVVNESGGIISGDGLYGYGLRLTQGGTVLNDDASIKANGGGTGVDFYIGQGSVINTNGAIIESSGIAINMYSDGTVTNSHGSTISGSSGVVMEHGGSVTNQGNSAISASGPFGAVGISGNPGVVNNLDGSTITGTSIAISLQYGGVVNNGLGSTIEANGTQSGDCSNFGTCAIFVAKDIYDPGAGLDHSLNLVNTGNIIGNVQLHPDAANHVTLTAGGSIQGDLLMGTNAQSTLTLNGDSVQPELYSNGVTGLTIFAGTLMKEGAGTWLIDSNDFSSVVQTHINGGRLQATKVLSGIVDVGLAGTLDAAPGVAGTLSNAGTVAVHGGNSTAGNYSQSSTGTLAVSLGSKLDVTGTATLSGGTLEVTGADSGYVSNTHTDVLTAAGGVTGTFSQLVKGSGVVFTATTINYDANNVWLDTTGLDVTTAAAGQGVSYTPASFGSAQRVQGAFEQLDDKIAAGDLSDVSGDFLRAAGQFQQSPTLLAAQASLQSLSGQLHAASAAMTFKAIDASSRALSDRFDNLLDKGTGFGMWMHNLSIGGDMARAGFDGVGFQLNGWLVGSDRQIGHSGVAGYAFGQSRGQQRLEQSFDHDNSRSTEGMMYAGWLNGNWYTQGRVGFGHFEQDVSRQILLGGSVQGVQTRYTGNYNMAYGESGLHLGRGDSHVTPFVNVQYARIDRGGFAEQGAGGFGLRSNAQTLDRWQAGLGVRAGRHWNLDGGRAVDLNARVQWQRTLASHGDVFDASFVGLQQWQPLTGIGLSRYSGLLGVGLDATLSTRTTLKFGYDYEMGQRDHAQMLSARLNVAF
jgi:fibronectin-binding autotransporter adhesin